jgi:hypothetical protein
MLLPCPTWRFASPGRRHNTGGDYLLGPSVDHPLSCRIEQLTILRISKNNHARAVLPPGSAAELVGECDEIGADEVEVVVGPKIRGLPRAVLGGAGDEGRTETAARGRDQIVVVGGDHQTFCGGEPEVVRGSAIYLRQRLELARDFSTEDDVPGQAGALCHVDDQRDVPVRERGQDKRPLEAREAGHGIRPGVQSMLHPVQVVEFRVGEVRQVELADQLVEAHPV